MSFEKLTETMQKNFNEMIDNSDCLFEVDVDRDEIWTTYLESFPAGTNEKFRERTYHDCSCCKNFIRNIGKAVVIENNQIKTIWDFDTNDEVYQVVIDKMDNFIKSKIVSNVYHTTTKKIGTATNYEMIDNEVITWNHFNLVLPNSLTTNMSEGMFKSEHRDNRTTLQTSLDTISKDSVETVLELIASNSLYRGNEWDGLLSQFLNLKNEYSQLPEVEVNNWLWATSFKEGAVMSKIKNHSIGTLLLNISDGMDLEVAVAKYEAIVAPHNYKRPKPIYTKQMLEKAQKTVEELGFMDSLPRRFTTERDITVRDLLFVDRSVAKKMGVFEELAKSIPENPRKYDKIEEIEIEHFINNVLPTANEIEIMVENKHIPNFCSLISPVNADSKPMFKWGNGHSWAYNGNIADSEMKQNVKMAGGNIVGDLRFSIQWNDGKRNPNDFDAHCIEPSGHMIYFMNKGIKSSNGGMLDVDIQNPRCNIPAVENIVFTSRSNMDDGVYKMFVRNFSHKGGRSGFKAEIEFDGNIHEFEYTKELRNKEDVHVANVTLSNGVFSIENIIDSSLQERTVWNITTNQFVKVSAICLSPNYWDAEVGNKHYMFMLNDCINPTKPNGFFNEYLTNDLYKHRKVFEALGSKMCVEDSDNQLSGLGFSSTKRNNIIVHVKGQIDRMFRLKI